MRKRHTLTRKKIMGISSTARSYDIHIWHRVLLDGGYYKDERYRVYKDISLATMKRYYALAAAMDAPGAMSISTEREIDKW